MGRALGLLALAAAALSPLDADACGCFASTNTVNPVVQAGERIVFAPEGNTVTAIIQIKFQGDAASFGWLLPLPSVPQLKVSTDELFEVLDTSTTPGFVLNRSAGNCVRFGCALGAAAPLVDRTAENPTTPGGGPLVLRDTAGPYDYAVLKADSKSELTAWLDANRFFVPGVTDAALTPYIRPGAYFLALKLRAGTTTGDLTPVLVRYTSDYPMIPLILTSATAVPSMGVEVFVLGAARAIPRNYRHVVINPLRLDWSTASNYVDLVTAAIAEAPDKHAFVTEYSGSPQLARGKLTDGTRFGQRTALAAEATPEDFVAYLYAHGFTVAGTADLSQTALELLEVQIPYPAPIANLGVTPQLFFKSLRTYLDPDWKAAHDWVYAGYPGVVFNAQTLSDDLWTNVAQPILDAEDLLVNHAMLTRMFTVLSPEDMTVDPVFAFNAGLPDVPLVNTATQTVDCDGNPTIFSAGGLSVRNTELTDAKKAAMPAALRVEVLSEEGQPAIDSQYAPGTASPNACSVTGSAVMVGLGGLWLRARRRRSQQAR